MILRTLTRLPSLEIADDLLTGVPAIDGYLKRLDAELMGRAGFRRYTLEEARDHLLEKYSSLIDQGLPAEEAAQQALDSFGSEKDIGAEQRQDARQAFFKNITLFGLPFAILMTAFSLLSGDFGDQPLLELTLKFVFYFVLYGASMSLFLTFGATHLKPSKLSTVEDIGKSDAIGLYVPTKYKCLAFVMLMFGIPMLLVCIFGIFGVGVGTSYGFFGNLMLIYICAGLVVHMSAAWTKITLKGNQIAIKTLLSYRRFSIAEVISFGPTSRWKSLWLPLFGRTHKLTFVTDQGKTQTLYLTLNSEVYNSELLVARIESGTLASA